MTYGIRKSAKFRKAYDTAIRRGWDIALLDHAIVTLASGGRLSADYRDHKLSGNFAGFRECHIGGPKSDWVLVYKKLEAELLLYLLSTGTHRELKVGD